MPLLTYAITNFNRLEDLKETIIQIKKNNFTDYEIVIVDSFSRDGSQKYLKELKDEKIKTYLLNEDKGIGYARLYALKKSIGEFIISLDDDCYINEQVALETINIFMKNKNIASIGYSLFHPKFYKQDKRKIITIPNEKYNNCYETNIYLTGSAWRRKSLQKVGFCNLFWFDDKILKKYAPFIKAKNFSAEIETDLCYNLIANNFNTVKIPELIAFHKMTPTNRKTEIAMIFSIVRDLKLTLKHYPIIEAIKTIHKIIFYCLYFSLINKKESYLNALIVVFKNLNLFLLHRKPIKLELFRKIKTMSIETNFTFSNNKKIYPK